MNHLRRFPDYLALIATLMAADASEASARKCSTTRNGLPVNSSAALLVVNGQIVGPLAAHGVDPQSGRMFLNEVIQEPKEVLRLDIVCLEVTEGDRIVGVQAVAIVTKSGAVEFMRSHLHALAALQEEHRTSKGMYAGDLSVLDFFASRAPLPIELTVRRNAWSARVTLEGLGTVCLVEGGEPQDVLTNRPTNTVRCEPA